LTNKQICFILDYLKEHKKEFSEYLLDHYKSCSGFISSYSYDFEDWYNKESVLHPHKLGAIFNFILLNEDEDIMDEFYEAALQDAYITGELINNL